MSTTDETPAVEATPSLLARLKRFAALTEEKRGLEAQLRPIQNALNDLENLIVEDMATEGMQSVTVDGMNVYRQREYYARMKEDVTREEIVQAFGDAGLGYLLSLSWQTLKAAVREWLEDESKVPDLVKQYCEIGEMTRLRCRKQ